MTTTLVPMAASTAAPAPIAEKSNIVNPPGADTIDASAGRTLPGAFNEKQHSHGAAFASPGAQMQHSQQNSSPAYAESKPSNPNGPYAKGGNANAGVGTPGGNPSPRQDASATMPTAASGAFAGGAALTAPASIPVEDAAQHQRTTTAEGNMSEASKLKINKAEPAAAEVKDAKQLAKVIKAEGKAQKASLAVAMKELSKAQKVQKEASTDESRALSAQSKAAKREHELHTKFLEAKAKFEHAEAELRAKTEQLEASRTHAQQQTEALSAKSREMEELRRVKGVDDREREARLRELEEIGQKK